MILKPNCEALHAFYAMVTRYAVIFRSCRTFLCHRKKHVVKGEEIEKQGLKEKHGVERRRKRNRVRELREIEGGRAGRRENQG